LQQTGRWDEWLALEQQAEARALAAGDPLSAAKRARMAGTVHLLRREASAVLASASRARTHFQQAQASVHELASAWRLEIAGHKLNQDYPAAIAACRELLEMDRHSDAGPMFQISALNDLARTEQEAGGLAAAERDYREAMRLARARGYPENVATCTSHLAALMLVRGDFPSAEALARQALLAAEAAAHKTQIATNCHYLAQALWRQGRKEEALQYAQRAVEIYTKLGSLDLPAAQATLAELEQAQ